MLIRHGRCTLVLGLCFITPYYHGPKTAPTAGNLPMRHIIFVPGFYGTRLVRPGDKKIVWLSAWQALFGSQTAARTGLGVPGARALVPGTVLDHIPVIPGLYAKDVYAAFLGALRARLGTGGSPLRIHLFAYDWREDYFTAVQQLARLVSALHHQGATAIAIIAHSLGGLITSYYLRYGSQAPAKAVETWEGASHIDKVVLATVPFQGSMTALHHIQYGARFGLNTTLMKAQAFATFPSVYEMLPTYAPVLLDGDLNPLPYTLHESDLWQRYGWGFLSPVLSMSAPTRQKRLAVVTTALHTGRQLSERLHAPLERSPKLVTQMLSIFARSHPTLARAVLLKAEPGPALLFHRDEFAKHLPHQPYRALFEDGDETVSLQSAQLPAAYTHAMAAVTTCDSRAAHSQVFNDRALRDRIFAFLNA